MNQFEKELQKLITHDQSTKNQEDEYIPEPVDLEIVHVKPVTTNEFDKQTDYQYTRSLHHNLLLQGNSALMHALKSYANTNNPQELKAITELIKTLSNSSIDMVKLQELVKDKDTKIINDNSLNESEDKDIETDSPKNINDTIDVFFKRK